MCTKFACSEERDVTHPTFHTTDWAFTRSRGGSRQEHSLWWNFNEMTPVMCQVHCAVCTYLGVRIHDVMDLFNEKKMLLKVALITLSLQEVGFCGAVRSCLVKAKPSVCCTWNGVSGMLGLVWQLLLLRLYLHSLLFYCAMSFPALGPLYKRRRFRPWRRREKKDGIRQKRASERIDERKKKREKLFCRKKEK